MYSSFKLDSAPKTSAWYDWNEWEYVYQLLFGFNAGSSVNANGELVDSTKCCLTTDLTPSAKDIYQLKTGIQRINTWSKRTRVPAAVESTAALVEVVIKDIVSDPLFQFDITTSSTKDEDPLKSAIFSLKQDRSELEKRLLYSMTIIRFVNLHAEQELKNHGIVRPLAEVVGSIGLPTTFVDLRHEATHGELPSVHSLRIAARQAIDWLQSHYWNIQRDTHRNKIKQTWNLLADYVRCTMGHAADPSMSTKAAKVLLQETPKAVTTPSLVVDVLIPLLLEGFLVPRKLKKLLENYNENNPFNPTDLIPASYIRCWHLALKTFHTTFPNFTSSLVVAVVQKLFRTEDSHERHETNSSLPAYNIHTSLKKIIHSLEGADHSIETFLHEALTSKTSTYEDGEVPSNVLPFTYRDGSDLNSRHKDLKCAFLMTWFSLLLSKFSQWTSSNTAYPIPFKMLLQTAIQHSHSKWSRSVVDNTITTLLASKTTDFAVSGSHLQRSLKSLQQLNETIYQNNNNNDKQLSIDQFEELEESNWLPVENGTQVPSRKRKSWVEMSASINWVDPIGWIPEDHYDGNSAYLILPSILDHFSSAVSVEANTPPGESMGEDTVYEEEAVEQRDETADDPDAVDLELEQLPKKVKKHESGKGVRLLFSLQEIGVV